MVELSLVKSLLLDVIPSTTMYVEHVQVTARRHGLCLRRHSYFSIIVYAAGAFGLLEHDNKITIK